MFKVALKSVLGNKTRLGLTALAVVLGVAFVAGTFILTDSMDNAFSDLLADANEGVDVYVNPASPVGDVTQVQNASITATLPARLVDDVEAVDGVDDAEGFVQGFAQIVGPDGEPVGGNGPPTYGFSWLSEGGPITLRDGRPPQSPDEVAIDAVSAETTGYEVGDTVPVLVANGLREFTLVGITGFGEEDNLLGATIASFEFGTAQEVMDKEGRLDQIGVVAEPGIDAETLQQRIDAAVGSDTVEVITAAEQVANDQADISEQLGFLNTALLTFAGIALFVGAFLIVNTFSIIVAQRTREFALLRAIGASARQVRTAVLIEALVVGIVAGTAGLFLGIGINQLMRALFGAVGITFPDGGFVMAPRTVIASYVLAVVVTVVAATVPARRAARISPVEAMRSASDDPMTIGRARTVVGGLLTAGGAILLAVGLVADVAAPVALVGFGAALTFIGVALLAPYLAGPAAWVVGALPARLGVAPRLGRNNAGHNPKRTASTASALMIGVALVTFVSVFAASATASVNQLFEEQLGADLVVTPSAFGTQMPPVMAEELREVPEVGALTPVRTTLAADADDESVNVTALDPATADRVIDLGVTAGGLADLDGTAALVAADLAEAEGLAVGDTVELTFVTAGRTAVTVAGVYENTNLAGNGYVVSLDAFDELVGSTFDSLVLVNAADGVDVETAQAAVEDVTGPYPGIQVQDQAELRAANEEAVDQLLNIMIGLLALALIIALIGIISTLALSVFERTREIGLLRAVGMTRRQTRTMVRWESVIVSVFGAGLGLAVGALFGWAVVTSLADEGLPVFEFPGGRLVTYLVAAAVAGVVAAVYPARRAARLDVLEAVTTE